MNPRIAVVEAGRNKAILKLVSQSIPGIVIPATPQDIERTLSQGVDIVVLDVAMPDNEGLKVLHFLKKAAARSAIHVITVKGLGSVRVRQEVGEKIRQILLPSHRTLVSPMTPEYQQGQWQSTSIEEIAKVMGISRSTLAQILGVSERNLARWVAGETKPRGRRDFALQQLKYLCYLLRRALKEEVIPRYLREPNPALGGRTPLLVLQSGDFYSIESDLEQLLEGVYA